MAVFRVIVLIVLALNGLGSVSDGVGDRKEYVSTFPGALFLASFAVEALL